jgi:hypothetical protein
MVIRFTASPSGINHLIDDGIQPEGKVLPFHPPPRQAQERIFRWALRYLEQAHEAGIGNETAGIVRALEDNLGNQRIADIVCGCERAVKEFVARQRRQA